jgi:NhaP-type Na+/H+ or K+/H+ antiporter
VHIALGLVVLVATVIAVTAVCKRYDLSSPLVLIVVGIVASYVPFVPEVTLRPVVVLVGLLPPLLYSASLNTSLVDFNANRRPILLLSVGLVVATTLGVGVIAHWLVPDLSWGLSFAIGAVVAPPDAVAATAIGRRIGLPRRIVTILEGESLLNDATALVALRTALASTVAYQILARDFVIAAGGGVLVGLVVFVVVGKVRRRLTDPLLDSGLSFITPFAAYVAAEEIHASGVIAVVVAGLLLGHKAPILQTAQSRIQEQMNWNTIAFLLEGGVFLLIGLQARSIITNVGGEDVTLMRVVVVCAAVLLGRDRDPAGVGLRRALPADPAGARSGDPSPATVDLHVPDRLGGDAGRRDARRGVRDPRGRAAPGAAPAGRLHGHRGHAVRAGTQPAVAGPPAEGCRRPTRSRTPWPARTCCSRRPRPASPHSRRSTTRTRTASARRSRTVSSGATSPPGSRWVPATTRRRARPTPGSGAR